MRQPNSTTIGGHHGSATADSTNIAEIKGRIRFALDQLKSTNGHHEFEHLCRDLARQIICPNILPATGPVSNGGDQGRDFETFRTYLNANKNNISGFLGQADDKPVAFCTTTEHRKRISAKIRKDVRTIMSCGTRPDAIYCLCVADLPVSKRHQLRTWATDEYQVHLEILDGQALAEHLSTSDNYWIARQYLGLPHLGPELPTDDKVSAYLLALIQETRELPLLPNGIKNLTLDQIMLPAVVPDDNLDERNGCRRRSLIDVTEQVTAFFLVGEAGQGKSTALQYLASHFARRYQAYLESSRNDAFLPMSIDLASSTSHMIRDLYDRTQGLGCRCSAADFEAWIEGQPVLFLVDSLDEVDASQVISQCHNLLRRCPKAHMVIASRPLKLLEKQLWPRHRLEPPSPETTKHFLNKIAPVAVGKRLSQAIERNHLLEVFRRPLFARLLALSSEPLEVNDHLSVTRLFDRIVFKFLDQWERNDESHLHTDLIRAFLAFTGHQLLTEGTFVVAKIAAAKNAASVLKRFGLNPDYQLVDQLISCAVSHGLLVESPGGLSFWHASFRDYFAGYWLARQSSNIPIKTLSRNQEWHECLVFYFGLAAERVKKRQLVQLRARLWAHLWLLRHFPSPIAGRRLVLVLRCFAEAATNPKTCASLVRSLPRDLDRLHLNGVSVPKSWVSDHYRHYHTASVSYVLYLVRMLPCVESKSYLSSLKCSLDVLTPALMVDADQDTVRRLVAAVAGNPNSELIGKLDPITEWIITSPDRRYREEIKTVFDDQGHCGRARLMATVTNWLMQYGSEALRVELCTVFESSLVTVTLHDLDPTVRAAAIHLLHRLNGPAPSPTESAVAVLMLALRDGDSRIRLNAWEAVKHSSFEGHHELLWRLLWEDDLSISLGVLLNMRLHGTPRRRFCRAVVIVLRRLTRNDADLAGQQKNLTREITESSLCCRYKRVTGFLMAAARHCPVNGGREYALYALYSCLHPWMAAWAIETFRGEPWNEAKCAALDCAVRILNSEAVPVISEALHDTNERVRGHAAAVCFLSEFAGNWIPHITKQLFELLEDSSSYPRDYALLTLKKYGLISKEWYPTMGHPPSAPAQS